jgi:hypothetical protein
MTDNNNPNPNPETTETQPAVEVGPLSWVMSGQSLTVVLPNGKNKNIRKDDKAFEPVLSAIRDGSWGEVVALLDVEEKVRSYGNGAFDVRDGSVFIDDEQLPDVLSSRIIEFADNGLPYEPLLKFWAKLQKNPSYRATQDLYAFLEANQHPITPDGNFIAYRGVRADFKDIYTGKFDNSPGQVLEMPRNKVDEDPNQTCSRGFHAAGWTYAHEQYGVGRPKYTVAVEIDPADVVAIPVDYANAKMRICKYKVLQVVTEHLNDEPLYDPDAENEPEEDSEMCPYCGEYELDCICEE